MAEQHEPLPAHTLTSPIVLAAFLYGAMYFFAVMASNGTQKLYDLELGDAMARRDAIAADVEWRNAFWSEVASDGGPVARASGLAKNVRRLFLDESRPGPEEMNAIIVDLRREASHGNDHGILAADGSLTDASLTQIEHIHLEREAVPEPVPSAVDASDPTFHKNAWHELTGWPNWAIAWSAAATILYLLHGWTTTVNGWRHDRGVWLGITEVQGAYARKTTIAMLYAPVLTTVAAALAIWHSGRFVIRSPSMFRDWWKLARDPYRAEIKKAERALAILRKEGADAGMIKGGEELVALWRTRHEHESNAARSEAVTTARNARIRAARESLLELESTAEAEGIKRPANGGAQRGSTGS